MGVFPVEVDASCIDFLAFSGYKWAQAELPNAPDVAQSLAQKRIIVSACLRSGARSGDR